MGDWDGVCGGVQDRPQCLGNDAEAGAFVFEQPSGVCFFGVLENAEGGDSQAGDQYEEQCDAQLGAQGHARPRRRGQGRLLVCWQAWRHGQ